MHMTKLAEQTVLVTGANRGMGREYVAQLLGRGAAKVYAAARDLRTVGCVDTDMAAAVQAPKADASDVVRQVLDGLEAGEVEVLADETSRGVRAHLSEPVQAQLARLVPVDA